MYIYGSEISSRHSKGEIRIGGFSSSNISGGAYQLQIGKTIQRYPIENTAHDFITMNDSASISEPILPTGYPLVPNTVYLISARETSASSKFDIFLASHPKAVARGLHVLGSGMMFDGSMNIAVSVVQPIIIHSGEYFAQLHFHRDPECSNPKCNLH